VPVLPVARRQNLALPLDGPITDLAYDAASDRFLVTTEKGIYITDGSFDRVLRHTIVDTGFSVDLAKFTAGAFLDSGTVMAVSENKSFVVLKENDKADAAANYRYFLASFDKFNEISRSRFTTVRARMMYVMAAAFDPETQSVFTMTVPNARVKRLVVSRFDRRDMTLSEEFTPALAPGSGLAFKTDKGSLDPFYVTGAAVAGGKLYAISAAFGTLLVIDPQARIVVSAHAIPSLERPVGLAIKGSEAYIVDAAGALTVVNWGQEAP
jgi:disulfide bond formation protein DsbB